MSVDELLNITAYFLDRHLEAGEGDRPALVTQAGTLTYEEVADMSNRAAGVFRDLGVGWQDRILLALPDGPELVAAFFGAARLGALAVPVSPHSRGTSLIQFLEDCRPRAIVVDEGALRELKQFRQQVRPDGLLVVGETAPNWSWKRRIEDVEPHAETAPTTPEDAACVLYPPSGGSEPRGVFYRHEDLFHASDMLGRRVGIRSEDRVYCTARIITACGLGAGIALPFSAGASAVVESQEPRPELVGDAIARLRPTLLFSTPDIYAALLETPGELDLAGIRLAISAGESLPAERKLRFRERFGRELLDASGWAELAQVSASGV